MADQPEPPRDLISRLMWDEDNPVTITGRTRKAPDPTLATHVRLAFDAHGHVIRKHVRRIRP